MNLHDIAHSPWLIEPSRLQALREIYARHLQGDRAELAAVEAQLGRPLAKASPDYEVRSGGVAVVSIEGIIAPKANLLTQVSGATSAQVVEQQMRAAAADHRVSSIVLSIDSPGGSVFGAPELAATVFKIAQTKPVVTVSDAMLASAAYWIGSAANRVFISGPTVHVGSIGVAATHSFTPESGSKTTDIFAGRYKRIASPNQPLSAEGAAYLQSQVDQLYRVFVDTVAEYRGVDSQTVLDRMADGRIFIGRQAIDAGLVDGFGTVDGIAAELMLDPKRYATRSRAKPSASNRSAAHAQPTEAIVATAVLKGISSPPAARQAGDARGTRGAFIDRMYAEGYLPVPQAASGPTLKKGQP